MGIAKITKKALAAAALTACLGFVLPVAHAAPSIDESGPNLVTNGDFETGDFTGWTRSGNLGFTSVGCIQDCIGTYALSGGPVGSPGSISQTIGSLVVGGHYNIHLFVQSDGQGPNKLNVEWDGIPVYGANDIPSTGGFLGILIDPVATASSGLLTISFQNDPSFLIIDDISVRSVAAAPEPMSLALLGLGLLGLRFQPDHEQAQLAIRLTDLRQRSSASSPRTPPP